MTETAVRRDTIAARRAGGSRKREQIVEAAVRAIEALGTDAGLGAVADQAGVPRPHVYRHFTGKGDLDQEVARYAARMLSEWIRPALTARGTPPSVIHHLVGRVVGWAADHPNLYRFRARPGSPAVVDQFTGALAAYLRASGYDARPPAVVVAGLVGMVDTAVVWWLDHPAETGAEALTEWLASQVWLVLSDMLRRVGHPVDPAADLTPIVSGTGHRPT
jgi:AcrR family transcriptional regulator